MNIIIATTIFILGSAIGSFLSVVIYRLHSKKKGTLLGRSMCPSCKKKIRWHHLLPIVSWLFLKGKCGYCGKKIGIHYIALELSTALLFLSLFINFNFIQTIPSIIDPQLSSYIIDWNIFSQLIFHMIEMSLLLAIFFYDLLYQEIPDNFSIPAIIIAIAGGFIFGTPTAIGMLIGGAGILSFFLFQYLISKGGWIGGGDLRLGLLVGVYLGWEKGLLAIILSYFVGAIFSIYLMLRGKVQGKTAIAFGPFMVLGIIVSLFYGEVILDWYLGTLSF